MRTKTRLQMLTAGLAATLALAPTTPAAAAPYEHSTFHEEFDTTNDCGDGLVLEFHDVIDGRVVAVRHGDGFVYGTMHWTLTARAVIPGTDLSLTVVNKGLVGHDVRITDNGDGTFTLLSISPARATILGPTGRPESHFSGLATVEQLWDHAGTPEDPTDDVYLEDLGSSLHGHVDAAGVCEVARRYAP